MFASRVARMAKHSTGIAGLAVDPNARQTLVGLYSRTLQELQAIPEDAFYRQSVESFTRYRMRVVEENEDCDKIEEIIGAGQVEELIEQAQDELKLIPKVAEWRLWEPLQEDDEPAEENTGYGMSPEEEAFHKRQQPDKEAAQ